MYKHIYTLKVEMKICIHFCIEKKKNILFWLNLNVNLVKIF